jgi:hypothetical protein
MPAESRRTAPTQSQPGIRTLRASPLVGNDGGAHQRAA